MADPVTTLSRSVEDYLKVIYSLSESGEPASTSQIADALSVQPASVSGMVRRLAESGFVEHAPYRGVRLSPDGTREALRIIRRHRILETYLNQRLGYSWEDVHAEAERLEHAASDALIERMAHALEHPMHDPHGAPIPSRSGDVEILDHPTLAETTAGSRVQIREVQDDDSDRLRYMESRGLLPGVMLSVDARAPFNGPITVRVGGPEGDLQTIGHELATRIRVARLDGDGSEPRQASGPAVD
jgi:DtxR family transcriptional regulator, Mn-dependent transcriptional regulator